MKKLLILLIVILSGCELFIDLFPVPVYDFDPPGLKEQVDKTLAEGKSGADVLDIISGWVHKNIKYITDYKGHGTIDSWQTPEETYHRLSGDCEDRALLFAYLAKRYYGGNIVLKVIKYKNFVSYHMIAEHIDDNYYFSFSKRSLEKIIKIYSYEQALIKAEYFQ